MNEQDILGPDWQRFTQRMMEEGFFPENLPPVFQVQNFYSCFQKKISKSEYLQNQQTEPARYSASKRSGARRLFSIPNPKFYVDMSVYFKNYRANIFEHLAHGDESASVPHFEETGRPAQISSHQEFHRLRRTKLASSRYIVRTDIAKYFHSIYTHSLPWALNGKREAKKDRDVKSTEVFGNMLDAILRNAQDGQTVGIPVGPDFSRYCSEILGKAIDSAFRRSVGSDVTYMRHVDDVFIGVDNQDQASVVLSAIRDAINFFQLDINESKTKILAAHSDLEPFWPVQIRREVEALSKIGRSIDIKSRVGLEFISDVIHFLDDVIRRASTEFDDGIVKFALKKLDEHGVINTAWPAIEPFLVRCAISFPHTWDYVSRIIAWRKRSGGAMNADWANIARKAVKQHAPAGNDSEVCWALWLLIELNQGIDPSDADIILSKCGALTCLMALDLLKRSGLEATFSTAKLLDRLGDNPMIGTDWILAYEADRQFNLKIKTKNLRAGAFVKEMYSADTSFYNQLSIPNYVDQDDPNITLNVALKGVFSPYDDEESERADGISDFSDELRKVSGLTEVDLEAIFGSAKQAKQVSDDDF